MPEQIICCPGGENSQTGNAVRKRYAQIKIVACETIPKVKESLEKNGGAHVVPMWNSHQGEIEAANFVWNLIEDEKIKLSDLWAQRIEFWLVQRKGTTSSYGKIGSVKVAQAQCSNFLEKINAELEPRGLTTIAHDEFRNGAKWDGALVAPNQGENEDGFVVANKQTANANNFTTFVKLAPANEPMREMDHPVWLSGVAMRPLNDYLGDSEQSFFEQMFSSANQLSDIPKLLFVLKRTAKVGLIFEGARLYAADLLSAEEIESNDISIYEKAGMTPGHYTDELRNLFTQEFPALLANDFILHRGVNTCLFACPTLGIFSHGYEVDTVEPVFCFYISKLFELIDNGAKCTPEQTQLFEQHKDAWMEKGSNFIQFKVIDP